MLQFSISDRHTWLGGMATCFRGTVCVIQSVVRGGFCLSGRVAVARNLPRFRKDGNGAGRAV